MRNRWILFDITILILSVCLPGCQKGKGTSDNAPIDDTGDIDAASDGDTDGDGDTDSDTASETEVHPASTTDSDTDTVSGTQTQPTTEQNTDTMSGEESDTDTTSESQTSGERNTDTPSGEDSDTGTDSMSTAAWDSDTQTTSDIERETGSDSGSGTESDSDSDTVTAFKEECQFTLEPRFAGNDDDAAPLVGVLTFETDRPSTATIHISGGGEEWSIEHPNATEIHRQAIWGVRPDTPYNATVTLTGDCAPLASMPASWRSPPLPEGFPNIELITSQTDDVEEGMTLFSVRTPNSYVIVVDALGRVRWYYSVAYGALTGLKRLSNGHLLFSIRRRRIVEIDWAGDMIAEWYAENAPDLIEPGEMSIPVDTNALHHSVYEMPNGNILSLDVEAREIEGFPTSTTDPDAPTQTALVAGDVIVEFSRTGEIVKRIPMLDLLDPHRVGYYSLGAFWRGWFPGSKDWAHCNSVVYDAESDAYMVSSRHQDAIVKVDRETESVVWILGNHENWEPQWQGLLLTPEGDLEWPYQQHAIDQVAGGVGFFDNGCYRVPAYMTPETPKYSRAVRYAIDEDRMTVTQAWSYGAPSGPEFFYSEIMSDADWQPSTGNVLITSGKLETDSSPSRSYIEILEVDETGTTVFELQVRDADGADAESYESYSGDRIPDIRFL
jgi:arylsulfate sulfotransferase